MSGNRPAARADFPRGHTTAQTGRPSGRPAKGNRLTSTGTAVIPAGAETSNPVIQFDAPQYDHFQGSLMGISTFGSYRNKYPSRSPEFLGANPDEWKLLGAPDGVQLFSDAPFPVQKRDLNQSESSTDDSKRCLWVIRTPDVPFVRECATVSPSLQSGVCKHTNLTGGQDAHCGSEVWLVSEQRLILNGASGRYPPREPLELEEIVRAFIAAGHEAWSMGWDSEVNGPARVLRGSPPWETTN